MKYSVVVRMSFEIGYILCAQRRPLIKLIYEYQKKKKNLSESENVFFFYTLFWGIQCSRKNHNGFQICPRKIKQQLKLHEFERIYRVSQIYLKNQKRLYSVICFTFFEINSRILQFNLI